MTKVEKKVLPDLIGNRFVKNNTAFLVDAVRNKRCTAGDLLLKAFIEKGISTKTTQRYINTLIDLGLLQVSDNGFLSVKEEP